MNYYLRLMKYVQNYWHIIAFSLVFSGLFVLFNSLSLWMVASLINTILVSPENVPTSPVDISMAANLHEWLKMWTANLIQQATPLRTLARLCWLLLGVFLIKNILLYIKNMAIGVVENRLIRDLRNDLFNHIQTLSISYFDQHKTSELSSISLNDVSNVRRAFSAGMQKLVTEPINLLVFITLLFIISWQLTLLAVLLIPVSVMVMTGLGRSLRRRSRRTAKQIAGVMNVLQEALSGIRIVKAFVGEKAESRRFRGENEKYYQLVFRRISLRNLNTPLTETIGVFMAVILLWVGGQQVLLGRGISAEDFMSFIIFMFAMLQPIRILSGVHADIQVGMASAERIFGILDVIPSIQDKPMAREITSFGDVIRFENVTLKYEGSDLPALYNVTTAIKKGDVVALVGLSGAGKSTFGDLIPRIYDVTGGSITIDGVDVRDIKIHSLRKLIGVVTQETLLFNDTVGNNIRYGDLKAEISHVEEAARTAHAWEFIQELPEGFDTIIGERGVKLSGGQRQRLAIARAVLKNPPILILDEATSALDTESENLVQEAIYRIIQDRTVIIIAHRLSTILHADKILVLEEGRLIESGSHDELLANGGRYQQLYDMQFQKAYEGTVQVGS